MGSHKEVGANVSFHCDVLQPLELLDQGNQEGISTQELISSLGGSEMQQSAENY